MKTSELIKYFEDEGYEAIFDVYCDNDILFMNKNHETLLYVNGNEYDTKYRVFNLLDSSKKSEYYTVLFEYTPPKEREETKYYYRLEGFGEEGYLNSEDDGAYLYIGDNVQTNECQTQFTKSEFKALREDIKSHDWEEIIVRSRE